MTKPTVIFVNGTLGMGGAEMLRVSLLEEMVDNHTVSLRVCVLRDRGVLADKVGALGVPLDVLGNRGGLLDIVGIFRLARYLRRRRPTIVQSSQFLTNLHTRIACLIARVPIVVLEEHGIYTWKRWYHRILDRMVNRTANGFTACSSKVAEAFAASMGVAPSRITTIHNCAAQNHFVQVPVDVESMRSTIGQSASFVTICVGTLRWEKGHKYLIDAWKILERSGRVPNSAELWIVGTGPLEEQLREMANGSHGISFLGRRDDTHILLRCADLFVLPSINEGFGIAIVEAMCAGLPIVSTGSGGIPEVVDDGRTGLLVPPNNSEALAESMASIIADPVLGKRLGTAARQEAEKRFKPSVYLEQLHSLYRSLVPDWDRRTSETNSQSS